MASAAGVTTSDLKAHLQVVFPNAGTTAEVSYTGTAAKAPVVVPIPGSSRPETVRASAQAVDLVLTQEQLTRLG